MVSSARALSHSTAFSAPGWAATFSTIAPLSSTVS